MPAQRRRTTVAERDRALRLHRRLTLSSGVVGTIAVAAISVAAAHSQAGASPASSAATVTGGS